MKGGVGMECIQYTVRGIPEYLDTGIRLYAAKESKSLNQAILDMLAVGLGYFKRPVRNDVLVKLAGTWVADKESDRAFDEMRTIDEEMWK